MPGRIAVHKPVICHASSKHWISWKHWCRTITAKMDACRKSVIAVRSQDMFCCKSCREVFKGESLLILIHPGGQIIPIGVGIRARECESTLNCSEHLHADQHSEGARKIASADSKLAHLMAISKLFARHTRHYQCLVPSLAIKILTRLPTPHCGTHQLLKAMEPHSLTCS